ncbi:MAG: hypothetical protein GXP54_05040, partial [Deltaproteobacteria bacterium]|nr:hypothetical protein [Deltaproteobacteria bacterium]
WGIIKGLLHISGDEALEKFLYEDLLSERAYPAKLLKAHADQALDYIYMGIDTNFDNPDLIAVALWPALYTENDPEVRAPLEKFMNESWWDRPGESHTARLCKQPYWHAIYLALTDRGADPALVAELRDLLGGFDLGPYWNRQRVNCDADEIAAGKCLAVDGKTEIILEGRNLNGDWMATKALAPSIRPPSNFDARSNPFEVNGGEPGDVVRLNPGPDLLAAYWIARFQQANPAGKANISPFARDHMPIGGWPDEPDASSDAGPVIDEGASTDVGHDAGTSTQIGGGGGCASGSGPSLPGSSSPWAAFAVFLAVLVLARAGSRRGKT